MKTTFGLFKIEPHMKELNEVAKKHNIVKWEKTGSKTIVGHELILVEYEERES
jgi:hypothetical protein